MQFRNSINGIEQGLSAGVTAPSRRQRATALRATRRPRLAPAYECLDVSVVDPPAPWGLRRPVDRTPRPASHGSRYVGPTAPHAVARRGREASLACTPPSWPRARIGDLLAHPSVLVKTSRPSSNFLRRRRQISCTAAVMCRAVAKLASHTRPTPHRPLLLLPQVLLHLPPASQPHLKAAVAGASRLGGRLRAAEGARRRVYRPGGATQGCR
jgi:hypothetical protein